MSDQKKRVLFFSMDNIRALIFSAFVGIGWFFILLKKYLSFGYFDWDLGIYANLMWNLSQGSMHASLWGGNFLVNHAEYIAFLLVPLYKIFPHALTLLALKCLAFSAGLFVFYKIARHLTGTKTAIFFVFLYGMHPANIYMMLYDFHFESLALPFIFLLFYFFFISRRLVPFVITAVLLSLIKENLPLLVIAFGMYAMFSRRENKKAWVIWSLAVGGIMFVSSVFIVMPYFRKIADLAQGSQYAGLFLPDTMSGGMTAGNMARDVLRFPAMIFSGEAWRYAVCLSGALNILPLFSPQVLFLGAPIFLQHLLSADWKMRALFYHYAATAVPFVFLAAVCTLGRWKKNFSKGGFLILLMAIFYLFAEQSFFFFKNPNFQARVDWEHPFIDLQWGLVRSIPDDAAVAATFSFLPELSARPKVYSFSTVWNNSSYFSHQKMEDVLRQSDYVLLDWNNTWIWDAVEARGIPILKNMQRFFAGADWRVEQAYNGLVLLRKDKSNGLKLVEASGEAFADVTTRLNLRVGDDLRLIQAKAHYFPQSGPAMFLMDFIWQACRKPSDVYAVNFYVRREGSIVFKQHHYIGYGIYPTQLWQSGEYVRDRFWFVIPPDFPPGDYEIAVYAESFLGQETLQLSWEDSDGALSSGTSLTIAKWNNQPWQAGDENK